MIIGIDPGFTGGITKIFDSGDINIYPMPVKHLYYKYWKNKKGEKRKTSVQGYDLIQIREIINDATIIIIEHQQPHPKQGIASTGKLLKGYGQLMGLAVGAGIELKLVRPSIWKKHFELSSDKKDAIEMAQKLSGKDFIPDGKRVPQDGLAESYLIALYGVKTNEKRD